MSVNQMIHAFIQGDHTCLGNIEACSKAGNDECTVCGARDCPRSEPLHYHHDGCPACCQEDDGSQYPEEFLKAHANYHRLKDEFQKTGETATLVLMEFNKKICESHGMVFE